VKPVAATSKRCWRAWNKTILQSPLVQAIRVRQYARAAGILAKTDTNRCKGPGRFWRSDATEANPSILCRAKALAPIRSTASALEQSLARRTNRLAQVSCADLRSLSRSLISKIKKQIDTPGSGCSERR